MSKNRLRANDYASDQTIRWCPGCGDFAILKQTQTVLAQLEIPKEKLVFISGIGCSSRFPYYMDTYGMHSIHGRATAIATGLRKTRDDLDIWVITGDGDALSIGGNHLIHLFRRNINVNLILFNNEIYGLTKGQFSPTSKLNLNTKSSPQGTKDKPFNTLSLALASGATFIARSIDREAKHLQKMLLEVHKHQGTSFLEVYQNCHIFNDGAFVNYSDRKLQNENAIFLEHNKVILFGEENEFGIVFDAYQPKIVHIDDVKEEELWVHDIHNLFKASILCNLVDASDEFPSVFGLVYKKETPTLKRKQVNWNKTKLNQIIEGQSSWLIK